MIRLQYYSCMTENTILATKGRSGHSVADYRNLEVRLPGRPRVAGVVSGAKSLAPTPRSTTAAVGKLAGMACLRQMSRGSNEAG